MERSRVTVEFSHLPGQVFEHEANGIYCTTAKINGPAPDDLKLHTVLEALEHSLDLWSESGGTHVGFPMPVTDHDEEFQLIVPTTVYFDVWPATLFCNNRGCGHVLRVHRSNELPERSRCTQCRRGQYVQLPYFQVHCCGNQQELPLPACADHPGDPIGFEDSGSFFTARFRCLTCRRPLEVQFRQCSCRLDWRNGGDRSERGLTPLTARDTRAFFGHHLTLVSIGGTRLTDALRAPKGVHYALGHYIGTVTDLAGLEDEARGRRRVFDDTGVQALAELRERYPDLPEHLLSGLTNAIDSQRGDEPALTATADLLTAETLAASQHDRRMMERAFLFAECAIDDLHLVATR